MELSDVDRKRIVTALLEKHESLIRDSRDRGLAGPQYAETRKRYRDEAKRTLELARMLAAEWTL